MSRVPTPAGQAQTQGFPRFPHAQWLDVRVLEGVAKAHDSCTVEFLCNHGVLSCWARDGRLVAATATSGVHTLIQPAHSDATAREQGHRPLHRSPSPWPLCCMPLCCAL